jgi:hypothetical protein
MFDNSCFCSWFAESVAISVRAGSLCDSLYDNGDFNYRDICNVDDAIHYQQSCSDHNANSASPGHHFESDEFFRLFVVPLVCGQPGASSL